ncbi:integrator complex subunit 12-like [Euwallacea fornicatus]|uniref:integrator complex subunit 12-like n=1 Tax=Euwallacea fornicatus TaxID=995702 RepID=UPI0033901858
MSNSNDLDPHLVKCIGLLYESRSLRKGDPVPLQYILEEAIFQKTGIVKDYTDFFQNQLPPRESEEPILTNTIYDDKANDSDNDLELDLFKDDLSCVVCNKMDVGVRNRLLECRDCHALYHQECHKPVVNEESVMDSWICSNCRGVSIKKLKTSEKDYVSSSKSSKSESHRHAHKSSEKHKSSNKSSSSSSSKSSSISSPSHSSRSDKEKSSKSSKSSSSKYYSEKRKHD